MGRIHINNSEVIIYKENKCNEKAKKKEDNIRKKLTKTNVKMEIIKGI